MTRVRITAKSVAAAVKRPWTVDSMYLHTRYTMSPQWVVTVINGFGEGERSIKVCAVDPRPLLALLTTET